MKFQYDLICKRDGGEHTIGSIPNEVAQYWDKRCDGEQSNFEEYMFNSGDDRNEGIPEKYQLREGYEHNDICHLYSVFFEKGQIVEVVDRKTEETIAEIELTDVLVNKTTCPETEFYNKENPHPEDTDEYDNWEQSYSLLFWQNHEKGWWGWLLETDETFDVNKLSVEVKLWSNLKLVDSFIYDGKEIESHPYSSDGNESKGLYSWVD